MSRIVAALEKTAKGYLIPLYHMGVSSQDERSRRGDRWPRSSYFSITSFSFVGRAGKDWWGSIADADVRALIGILAEKIASLWSPPNHQGILSAEAPRLEFD